LQGDLRQERDNGISRAWLKQLQASNKKSSNDGRE
jgi:hypothetical protein